MQHVILNDTLTDKDKIKRKKRVLEMLEDNFSDKEQKVC